MIWFGQKEYNNKRRIARRLHYIECLGGRCVVCKTTQSLQFDHVDPAAKRDRLSRLWLRSLEIVEAEVAKCQLLCIKCHAQKTAKEQNKKTYPLGHGSVSMYRNQRCRCGLCRAANALFQADYYKRRGRKKYGKRAKVTT